MTEGDEARAAATMALARMIDALQRESLGDLTANVESAWETVLRHVRDLWAAR